MKSQSLLSAQSDLSQLSNISYHGQKKQYTGAQFFKESLPPGHASTSNYHNNTYNNGYPSHELKAQQVQLYSLEPGYYRNCQASLGASSLGLNLNQNFKKPTKNYISAFTPYSYWVTQPRQNMQEGMSENQSEGLDQPQRQKRMHEQLEQKLEYQKQKYMQSIVQFQKEGKLEADCSQVKQEHCKIQDNNQGISYHNEIFKEQELKQHQEQEEQQNGSESQQSQEYQCSQLKSSSKSKIIHKDRMNQKKSQGCRQQKQKIPSSIKNQTKNIPKNYGKAIIIFIQTNRSSLESVVKKNGNNFDTLLTKLKNLKRRINTISDLRTIWKSLPESKSLRIISNYFLRKFSLHYIYNSRIKTRMCHAKYKRRLQQAIINPDQFNHIKDY